MKKLLKLSKSHDVGQDEISQEIQSVEQSATIGKKARVECNSENKVRIKSLIGCLLQSSAKAHYTCGQLSFQESDMKESKIDYLKDFYQKFTQLQLQVQIDKQDEMFEYECTLLIEIWKNLENLPILENKYLENLIVKILNENYHINLRKIAVKITGNINHAAYPYLAVFSVQLYMSTQEHDALQLQTCQYALTDDKTIFYYLVHFEPAADAQPFPKSPLQGPELAETSQPDP